MLIEIVVVIICIILIIEIVSLIIKKTRKNKLEHPNNSRKRNIPKDLHPYIDYLTDPRFTIRGGQGPKVVNYNDKKSQILNCSEQVLLQTYSIYRNGVYKYRIRDLIYFQGQCLSKFKDMVSINLSNGFYFVPSFLHPRYFSDVLIDAVGSILMNRKIENIFCKCEVSSSIWFETNYLGFKDKFTRQSNNLSYLLYREDDELLCLTRDIESPIWKNKLTTYITKPNIHVFIEFCYENFNDNARINVVNLYPLIHELTSQLIYRITNTDTGKLSPIYIYRFVIDSEWKLPLPNIHEFELENENDGKVVVEYSLDGMDRFRIINIPQTETSLDMDEFLLISTKNYNLYIQIEHSENMENHKSNIVEFILRVGRLLRIKDEKLLDLLIEFKYGEITKLKKGSNPIKKLNYELMERKTSITSENAFKLSNETFFEKYFGEIVIETEDTD